MDKKLLDGYTGVKFDTVCIDNNLPEKATKYKSMFKESGDTLRIHSMAPANGGNISMRFEEGFLITSSGCNLGCVGEDEIAYVEDFSIEDKMVRYRGPCLPSSETFLHGLLYSEKKDISAVMHAHDEIATSMSLRGIIHVTDREEPYGTVELAVICLEAFKKEEEIVVLKNHGYVAIGSSLGSVTEKIVEMHKRLIKIKGRE
ncbi:MAG: class II aldolase/adducin family protein [Spirochaetes bacterium]|nr:class II aldolase/adducin family protein [Spirochaetota bacterium]